MRNYQVATPLMGNILIIKLGALGDVLRTTPLLRVLKGKVSWLTAREAAPLLLANPFIERLYLNEELDEAPPGGPFDLLFNLEDEPEAAALAARAETASLIGAYMTEGGIRYTESARPWFDLSLISRFGRQRADEMKMANRLSYQEHIFSMIGRRFQGEEYILSTPLTKAVVPGLVGLEARAGSVWPMKRWNKYDALAEELAVAGFKVKFLEQRPRLEEYIEDINECEFVVSGDTLAMHVALALEKRVVAIFTCTTPHEIYGYARMVKVVSPCWEKHFYRRDFVPEAADAISVKTVFDAVRTLAG